MDIQNRYGIDSYVHWKIGSSNPFNSNEKSLVASNAHHCGIDTCKIPYTFLYFLYIPYLFRISYTVYFPYLFI